jgi:type VI secretion system protein ImpJ
MRKILWGEGLFLRPQHFQRQDAYHEARVHDYSRIVHPYCWGVRSLRVDTDALSNGTLRALEISVISPDGDSYHAPGTDDLPPPVSLDSFPTHLADMTFYLALSPLKELGSNYTADEGSGLSARFVEHHITAQDWFTQAETADVTVLKKTARLLSEVDPREAYVTMPLFRVKKMTAGGFELDNTFVAPSLSVRAAPALFTQLRRLLDILQAKVNALYGFHREPNKNIIEFRSGDVASFWLLHTTSSAFASLSHFLHHPALHPERLYQELMRLAGALMTFSKNFTLSDLPQYQHHEPTVAFAKLDHIIRELLETVISTRYFAIALNETKPSFWLGRLDSEKIDEGTRFYIAVSADMPGHELVDAVPLRFKAGGPDDVEKLVLSAMPGIKITHTPQVPGAIPVKPGHFYFEIEPRGALYDRMLQQQAIMIYVPSGLRELKLELIAVAQ